MLARACAAADHLPYLRGRGCVALGVAAGSSKHHHQLVRAWPEPHQWRCYREHVLPPRSCP
eukprot:6726091-Prorocentrum_lima.AAC.1